ncbi:MAG TPA: hypothetical protein VL285_12925 [Bryobacteraceae bacterium]|jgi:hypothetical protein|nr:hypothetical protein [Bryobacteraceae bacterium]
MISHIADAARWKTTLVLVNTDTAPVQLTVNFWRDDGSPFTVPAGGSRIIETDLGEGASSQSISRAAISAT